MKRKKGAKASSKKIKRNDFLFTTDPNSPSISMEEANNTGQIDESQGNFELEVEQHDIIDNKASKASNSDHDFTIFKSAVKGGHNRVKVILKTSKLLEPHKQHTSDVQMPSANTPSDTDKSNSQFVPEMNEMTFGMIDTTFSDGQTLETGNMVSENPRRKPGSIKIKSSGGSGLSDFSLKQMESKIPNKGICYNSKDLSAALNVIKKVMKMDAAGPFNAPVNPVALGIPDYFEIIDTPMDFGSICHELEHGSKYKNSSNVYNDVQFIWDNCYKYNNKGDYILELMKRVKKNFMKYWTAAGLITEISIDEDALRPHQDKSTSKMKSKHKRRRHGIDGHKSNCMCAVCAVRRRRKEREEHLAELGNHRIINQTSFSHEPKLEASSADNPCSEATASSFDHSPQTEPDTEIDEAEKVNPAVVPEPIIVVKGSGTINGETDLYIDAPKDEISSGANGDQDGHFFDQEWLHSKSSKHSGEREDKNDNEIQGEIDPNNQKKKPIENSSQQENHSALLLCKALFPGSQNSVWNGPHSFNRRHATERQHKSPIQSALAKLMQL